MAPQIMSYPDYIDTYLNNYPDLPGVAPQIISSWDHTPRSGMRGSLFVRNTPQRFGDFVDRLLRKLHSYRNPAPFIMIKSWNEWGEGNYLEPDVKYGKGYIKALRKAIDDNR